VLSVVSFISFVLGLTYVFALLTFTRGWGSFKKFNNKTISGNTKASIIVAARNEEENIRKTIDAILAQNYPSNLFELIVIDDHSTDKTGQIVKTYPTVKLISLNETKTINSYKKKAIQTAIGEAKGELIITTDADCYMGNQWLSTIVAYYEATGCKLISSPVAYYNEKSNFEKMQSLEFAYLIGLGASTIGIAKPSTCNGANLAYQKSTFFEVGGFTGIDDLASGDDELLLHKIAAIYPDKIGFLKSDAAIVYTEAKPTLAEFIQQRKRWASKSTKYKNKWMIALGVGVWLYNLSMVVNILLALFIPAYSFAIFLVQLLSKIIFEAVFMHKVMSFFGRIKLLCWLPLVSILHVVYIIYIGIAGNSGKYTWKGRSVN
jgi:cellulose synthase/poly-beta-1,6-N-acetylglucosamine synthase-like glycosyltransferase